MSLLAPCYHAASPRDTSGLTPTDYQYTGQRNEAALGVYFYNARWYDPALGRFAQADTLIPGAGNASTPLSTGSLAWDRYAYVNDNPLRYTDPSGHYLDDSGPGIDPDKPIRRKLPDLTNYGESAKKVYDRFVKAGLGTLDDFLAWILSMEFGSIIDWDSCKNPRGWSCAEMITNVAGGWFWTRADFLYKENLAEMDLQNMMFNWLGRAMQTLQARFDYTMEGIKASFDDSLVAKYSSIAADILAGSPAKFDTWYTWGNPGQPRMPFTEKQARAVAATTVNHATEAKDGTFFGDGKSDWKNAFFIFTSVQDKYWKTWPHPHKE